MLYLPSLTGIHLIPLEEEMRKIAYVILFLVLLGNILYAADLPLVTAIEIKGLKRIEEGAVKAKISQKIQEPLSQDKTNDDIKSIFKMGYFDDVKVEIEAFEGGIKLIYAVKEKPTIIKVEFQGNKELEDSKLREKIAVTPGAIADTVLIQENAVKVSKYYEEEGYWMANVVPVINKISENEIGLTYQIDEGTKVKIKNIVFEGNKTISSRQIRKTIETKEWWLFSFITSTGYLKRDLLERDIDKIKNLYFDNGYLKVIIAEPEISVDKARKAMTITIRISEEDQFRISSLDFRGNTAFDNGAVQQKVTVKPGEIFRKNLLEKDIQAISSLYSENGYALVSVTPDLDPDESSKTVKVMLSIDEGDKYRIGRIEISGNTKTRDKVIRREIRFDEGETYNSAKLKRSYERITNLNFFDGVDISPKPRFEDKVVDFDVKVKEKPTGFLSVGGGYSSVDKFIFMADITQGNLFGRGQFIKLKGELGGKSTFYEVSFRDPWFLDRPVSFSTGLYKTTREYIEYDKDAFGFYVDFGKSFAEYWRAGISYNFEKAKITDIKEDASVIIRDQEGSHTTSSVTPSISRDTRDNFLDPMRGSRNSLSVTFAGLGGTNGYIKTLIDSAWYFPFKQTAFMVRGRFGYSTDILNKILPLYERYYVGGIYTVRGVGFGEAGPKDPKTGDPIGGTEELIFNLEYIFPLVSEMRLKGVVFFDAGNAYDNFVDFPTLRYTSGLGFRWISPIGPLRVEWGYNLDKKPGESSSKFEFAFGSFFN